VGGPGGGYVKAPRTVVKYFGQTPILSDAPWAVEQQRVTGSAFEEVFSIERNGVKRIFRADGVSNPFLIEVKAGNLWQFQVRNRKLGYAILRQTENYFTVIDAREFGFRGVQYKVTTEQGTERLLSVFTKRYPNAISSGKLSVEWVP
jgi:hypothetical protein